MMMDRTQLNALSHEVIKVAIDVHKNLGPGLLEHVYREVLAFELQSKGFVAKKEVPVPIIYKSLKLEVAYRADIIVENEIILELKATEKDNPLYVKQLLTYLRLYGSRLGFLMNFNKVLFMEGLTRVVNNL